MRFQPTDRPDRGHVGKNWTRYQLRSMQIVLQATHGIVSGAPEYFKRAFGDTPDDFVAILLHPHDYIFNRDWYERHDKKQELHSYRELVQRLTAEERAELLCLLSSCDPRDFGSLPSQTTNNHIKSVLPYYMPKAKSELFDIWARQKALADEAMSREAPAEDERVEDAGLEQDLENLGPAEKMRESLRKVRAVA